MLGVVDADAGDRGGVFLDRFLVGGFDKLFRVEHYLVQLRDGLVPLLRIEGRVLVPKNYWARLD